MKQSLAPSFDSDEHVFRHASPLKNTLDFAYKDQKFLVQIATRSQKLARPTTSTGTSRRGAAGGASLLAHHHLLLLVRARMCGQLELDDELLVGLGVRGWRRLLEAGYYSATT